MNRLRIMIFVAAALLLVVSASAQDPIVKHFDKDGLSFDYPAAWQFSDQSTGQMQFIELAQGDVVIRVRSAREWLKTPEKEAHARKLFQDQYIDSFAAILTQQLGAQPKRSTVSTQIAGTDAPGVRLRGDDHGVSGGMDSYVLVVSDRLVQLSIIGSDQDIVKSAPVWDTIRNTLKVEPPPQPQPKATPKPSPAKKP